MPTLELLGQDLHKPVISTTSTMTWNALRVSGIGEPVQGFGRLLHEL
jgi:maleate isomerase/arylmalonate decarboxylase